MQAPIMGSLYLFLINSKHFYTLLILKIFSKGPHCLQCANLNNDLRSLPVFTFIIEAKLLHFSKEY